MTNWDKREADSRYRKGYVQGFAHAVMLIQQGAQVNDLDAFINGKLEAWRDDPDIGNFVPAPGFKKES